jgi:hypothetical protein
MFWTHFCYRDAFVEFSAAFEHTIEVRQRSNLHDVPVKERLRRDEITSHGGEENVFDLPALSLQLFRGVVSALVRVSRERERPWYIKVCELAEECSEAVFLIGPCNLRALCQCRLNLSGISRP